MAVAKSFQALEIVTEPYAVNGRMYVKVKNATTGALRQVRWYTDYEYQKMYPNEKKPADDPYYKSQKDLLGFKEGFITIFKGNTYDHKEWFKENGATYRKLWGWGIASTDEVPAELPAGVEAIRLEWSAIGTDEGTLKPDHLVKEHIESLMYEEGNSDFQGSVGDRLQLRVKVIKALSLDGYYGPSTMHIMQDENENVYVWTTASKSWAENSEHFIRGTVKEHKTYRNVKQTVLTRCSEVKK